MNIRPFPTVIALEIPARRHVGVIAQNGSALIAVVIFRAVRRAVVVAALLLVQLIFDAIEDAVLEAADPPERSEDAERDNYEHDQKDDAEQAEINHDDDSRKMR